MADRDRRTLITPLPGVHTLKPGSASRPFFGVEPVVLRDDGTECAPNEGGKLCIKKPWPGIMRTTWGDHDRFINTYFSTFKNMYFTGDGCRVDADGDYWLLGRVDDVVNVSGHRIGTAEVESALVSHPKVAEAAVAPMPHDIKGQALYAFVTLKDGIAESEELKKELAAARPQGNRGDCRAGQDSIRARPAEDALRQNHAPHPAQDRREPDRPDRRHHHAGRLRGGGGAGQGKAVKQRDTNFTD